MKLRRATRSRRGRIEIIPMIDVMFFLLATFMLASLSMQNLQGMRVNLPKGRATALQTREPLTLTIAGDGEISVDKVRVTLDTLAAALRSLFPGSDGDVVVAADSAAPNGVVVQAMLRAREAGAQHFLIAVQRD
jgi:biopolymer transport protein ExbD